MKAQPYQQQENGNMHPCEPADASHVYLVFPTQQHRNRMLPVLLKGTRHGTGCWSWNGDTEKVTLKPSILMKGSNELTDEEITRLQAGEKVEPVPYMCHVFVNEGKVQFLSDCTHELAGMTVDLCEVD